MYNLTLIKSVYLPSDSVVLTALNNIEIAVFDWEFTKSLKMVSFYCLPIRERALLIFPDYILTLFFFRKMPSLQLSNSVYLSNFIVHWGVPFSRVFYKIQRKSKLIDKGRKFLLNVWTHQRKVFKLWNGFTPWRSIQKWIFIKTFKKIYERGFVLSL